MPGDDLGFVPEAAPAVAPVKAAAQTPNDDLGFVPEKASAKAPADDLGFVPEGAEPITSGEVGAHSDGMQQAIAGAEGLAKGIAGPLATLAETKLLGVKPEDIVAREEENPWTHGIAEGAGLLGSALIPGLGEYTLGAKIGAAGKAAASAAKALEIGKVGQTAIKLGIEGGLFHLSDNTSKMILGQTDPEAPVASLMAGMPAAILLGGGLGYVGGKAGVKLQEMASAKMANTASQWLADLGSRFDLLANHGGLEGTTEAAADQAQHLYDTVSAAVDGGFSLKRESVDKLTQNIAPEKIADHIGAVADFLKNAPNALKKSGLLEQSAEEWQSKVFPGEGNLPSAGDVFEATDHLKKQLQELAAYDKRDPSIFAKPAYTAARDMAEKLRLSLEHTGTWGEMGDFQKQLNSAYSEMKAPLKDFLNASSQKVGGGVQIDKGKLFNIFKQLGKGKLSAEIRADKIANFFEPAQKMLKTVNDLHAAQGLESNLPAIPTDILDEMLNKNVPAGAKSAQWLFDSGQSWAGMAASHTVGTAVGSAVGHPYWGFRAGEALYPVLKEMGKKPTRWAVSGLLRAMSAGEHSGIPEVLNHAEAIKNGATKIENSLNNLFKVGGKQYLESDHSEAEREKLHKFVESGALNQQIQNQAQPAVTEVEEGPRGFAHGGEVLAPEPKPVSTKPVGRFAPKKDPIAAVFPEQSMLLGAARGRVNNYLNQLRPQDIQSKRPFDEHTEDKVKEKSYHRALDIANKPLSVIDHIKNGTLQPEDMLHMHNLYPELTNHLQKQLTQKITEAQMKNEKPPYKVRQALSLFMGTALDANLTPQNIQAAQATFVAQKAAQQAQGQAPKKGGDKLSKVDNQYRTPEQAAVARQTDKP